MSSERKYVDFFVGGELYDRLPESGKVEDLIGLLIKKYPEILHAGERAEVRMIGTIDEVLVGWIDSEGRQRTGLLNWVRLEKSTPPSDDFTPRFSDSISVMTNPLSGEDFPLPLEEEIKWGLVEELKV